MARQVIGFSAILSILLAFEVTVTGHAAQELVAPRNATTKPANEAPAPPTATDVDRARAAQRLQSKVATDRDTATRRLLDRATPLPIAGVVHLNGLVCRDRQERGHDEVFILTAGRRTPARGEFRLDDEGSERAVHDQELFQHTLAPGQEASATVEVWESDGGGKRDDLIGSVRVTLVNVDGAIHAAWHPGEFARPLPTTATAAERFELLGNDAHYEIELSVLAASPEPARPAAAQRSAPPTRVVETVVVPAPPAGPSVRVVVPPHRVIVHPRRWYPPRRHFYRRW